MRHSFDHDAFDRQALVIIVHSKGKSFRQLAGEIAVLRREYQGDRDVSVRRYVRKSLNRRLLMFAIDTSQRRAVVDRLYSRNVKQGFNNLHAEVTSAIEYADFCAERGDLAKGLRALYKVRNKLSGDKQISSSFVQAIEKMICHLKNS